MKSTLGYYSLFLISTSPLNAVAAIKTQIKCNQHQQAQQIKQEAEFLPEGNWTEQLSIQ